MLGEDCKVICLSLLTDSRDSAWTYQTKKSLSGGGGVAERPADRPGGFLFLLSSSRCGHGHLNGGQTGKRGKVKVVCSILNSISIYADVPYSER